MNESRLNFSTSTEPPQIQEFVDTGESHFDITDNSLRGSIRVRRPTDALGP